MSSAVKRYYADAQRFEDESLVLVEDPVAPELPPAVQQLRQCQACSSVLSRLGVRSLSLFRLHAAYRARQNPQCLPSDVDEDTFLISMSLHIFTIAPIM